MENPHSNLVVTLCFAARGQMSYPTTPNGPTHNIIYSCAVVINLYCSHLAPHESSPYTQFACLSKKKRLSKKLKLDCCPLEEVTLCTCGNKLIMNKSHARNGKGGGA